MTARDFAAMTDQELAQEAARLMGRAAVNALLVEMYGKMGAEMEFCPTLLLGQAAAFGAAFLNRAHGLERWFELRVSVLRESCHASMDSYDLPKEEHYTCDNASEARCRTEAVCAAWLALEGERG